MKTTSFEFATIVNGKTFGENTLVTSYVIDSTKATEGCAFFAIKGNRTDGHKYIDSAIENGASMIVIDKAHIELARAVEGVCFVVVKDTLTALQLFAQHVRVKTKAKIITITGSCGKTTTKEMIAAILAQKGKTVKTPGNYNSEYGLPLSLLLLEEDTEYGVFEIGTDRRGMMANSTTLAGGEVSAITNIGISHLASYYSREELAEEKSDIFLPYTKGFVLSDIDYLDVIKRKCNDLTVVEDNIEDYLDNGFYGYKIKVNGRWGKLPLLGFHNLKNASLAIALTSSLGATADEVLQGLSTLKPIFGRSRVFEENDVTIIEDCYNATSDSMLSALSTLSHLDWNKGRKIALLADMVELGFLSEEAHRKIGQTLCQTDCEVVFLYGEQMRITYDELKKLGTTKTVFYTNNFSVLFNLVQNQLKDGDLLLLKGSRAMSLEKIYPALRKIS